jgi:bile-salt sulfotransferase
MATLKANFYQDVDLRTGGGPVGHWANRGQGEPLEYGKLWGNHEHWKREYRKCFYAFRDGRDVALSLWRTKIMQNPTWHDLSFAEFLRKPLDWRMSPGKGRKPQFPEWTVVEHWLAHLRSWENHRRVHYVRYEDLVLEPEQTIQAMGKFLGIHPERIVPIREWVGYDSNRSQIGEWQDFFTSEDLDFFSRYVPEDFWGLS